MKLSHLMQDLVWDEDIENGQIDRDLDTKRRRTKGENKAVRNKRSAKENAGQISGVDKDMQRPPTIRKIFNPISGRYEYYRSGRNT